MTKTHTIEASDLGLRPGHWPTTLQLNGWTWERTSCKRDEEGDLLYVRYCRRDNREAVLVYND